MKKILAVIFVFSFSFSVCGQSGYLSFPDYNTVLTKFFTKYSIKGIQENTEIKFEKRPDGWHVAIRNYAENQRLEKDELYWDLKSKSFKKINFIQVKSKTENEETLLKFQNEYATRYYNICPYYGYPGWDWDVIQNFRDAKNLPDSTLYGLGRAYSWYASNLLNNNSGLALSEHQFVLPKGKNCMTLAQLDTFRYYRHLGIETFNKVKQLNPNYETIVGDIGIKAANEYVVGFLELRVYQNEQEAQKELIPGLYPDFYLSAAKNYLNSCALNAILITSGDNDTYPLLYIQAMYGFRKDVLVVNYSLLQTERYINSLRERILDAQGLNLTITPEEIADGKREVVVLNRQSEERLELSDVIKSLRDDQNLVSYGSTQYYTLSNYKFMLSLETDTMKWEEGNNYLFRSQVILQDILASNKLNRPLYFTITMSQSDYNGLDDYLSLEGLAYRLTSKRKQIVDEKTGNVNSNVAYHNMMSKFEWKLSSRVNSNEKLLCTNYRSCFDRIARTLIVENKNDSALKILDKCIEVFPDNRVHYDYFLLPIIECYYQLKAFEKGNAVAKTLIFNVRKNIGVNFEKSETELAEERDAILEMLREYVVKYKQDEIKKIIDGK